METGLINRLSITQNDLTHLDNLISGARHKQNVIEVSNDVNLELNDNGKRLSDNLSCDDDVIELSLDDNEIENLLKRLSSGNIIFQIAFVIIQIVFFLQYFLMLKHQFRFLMNYILEGTILKLSKKVHLVNPMIHFT